MTIPDPIATTPDLFLPQSPPRPRRVTLDFDRRCSPDWLASSLSGSALLNAYSLVFPALETLMMRQMGAVATKVAPIVGEETIRGFIQQEGSHAREHRRSFDCIRAQGFEIDRLQRFTDRMVLGGLEFLLKKVVVPFFGDAFAVGIFAGAEHWTACLSDMALRPGTLPRTLADTASPESLQDMSEMEALFLWHCCEELEHKSVVADSFRALGGGEAARITSFLFVVVPPFLFLTITAQVALMAQLRRVLGPEEWKRRGKWRGLARDARLSLGKLPAYYWHTTRSYLKRGFDPRDCETDDLVATFLERLYSAREVSVGPSDRGKKGAAASP